jgi:hypothetical protein
MMAEVHASRALFDPVITSGMMISGVTFDILV